MITPAYGLTATERVLPSFVLDWTTGQGQDAVDVVRAGVATFVGSDGLIQYAAENTQRVDYSTGISGLLVEEARTNLLTYSEEFSNSAWLAANATVTSDAIIAPDGTLTGDKLVSSGTGTPTFQGLTQTVSALATEGQFSIYLKADEITQAELRVFGGSFSTVSIVDLSTQSFVSGTGNLEALADGWFRVSVVAASGSTSFRISLAKNGSRTFEADGTSGLYLWGAQLEEGAFPTSYIPTTTAAVTRNADVATMTGTNFSDWFNPTEGTIFIDYLYKTGINQRALTIATDSAEYVNVTAADSGKNNYGVVLTDDVAAILPGVVAAVDNTNYKIAISLKENNMAGCRNASFVATDTLQAMPVGVSLYIGNFFTEGSPVQFLNSTISRIAYYPQRLTNAELQAITK